MMKDKAAAKLSGQPRTATTEIDTVTSLLLSPAGVLARRGRVRLLRFQYHVKNDARTPSARAAPAHRSKEQWRASDSDLTQAPTYAATTGSRDAATSGGIRFAAAPVRERGVDFAVAPLRERRGKNPHSERG